MKLLKILITGLFFLLLAFSCDIEAPKPNVILIMADDLGYNDLSCFGSDRINTPNIDYLAGKGIRFLDYHSSGAVCSPTRAALMTGRYQQRSGIEGVITAKNHRHTGMSTEEFTLAEYFKTQDYVTGLIGKWHLGYDTSFSPVNNGFDYFKGYVSGNVDYHSHVDQEGYFDWWIDKDTLDEEGYTTDLFTEAALKFIDDNESRPFFLYLAHEAPHGPYQGRNDPAIRKVGRDFRIPGPKVDIERAYKEMIEVMDEGIGRIFEHLKFTELLSKTLIIFCSDNGAAKNGSNYPLRGFKASLWEGGHRVPAIAYWNGHIKAGLSTETVLSMDIFPTLLELTNPAEQARYNFDGQSFMSQLSDEYTNPGLSERPLFLRFNKQKSVRLEEWKLLVIDEDQYLFNLKDDLSEQNNLVDEFPEKTNNLLNLLKAWELEMNKYELRSK